MRPGQAGSDRLDDVDEPAPGEGDLLVQTLAVGVCGTDLEISRGEYGWAPPGRDRLVLGHESLGRVLEAPAAGQPTGRFVPTSTTTSDRAGTTCPAEGS